MSARNRLILITALLSAAMGAFTAFYIHSMQSAERAAHSHALVGSVRPHFSLHDLNENSTPVSNWDGQIVLLNFWAAWCPPCRKEIPIFGEVREHFHDDGFEVVGIAIDDKEKVVAFLESLPEVRYPQLIGYNDALKVAAALGNHSGGLPYSVLVDRSGIIRFIKAGELDKKTLVAQLEALLAVVE